MNSLNKQITTFLYLMLIVLTLGSCSKSPEARIMGNAEAIMDEDPAKALSLINEINDSSLRSDEDKALYALLSTQIRDKNLINQYDDSLINIAIDYYDNRFPKDRHHQMWAHFYKFIINLNLKNYSEAMSEAMTAQSLCDKDWFFELARINDMIAELYVNTRNIPTSILYREKGLMYFKLANKYVHAFYTADDLARSYLTCGNYERSRELLDSLYNLRDEAFRSLRPSVTISKIYYYLKTGDNRKALEEFHKNNLSAHTDYIKFHYAPLAVMFATNNEMDSTIKYMELEKKTNPNYIKNEWYTKANCLLTEKSGDYKKIYEAHRLKDSLYYANIRNILDSNVSFSQATFYNQKQKSAETAADLRGIALLIAVIIVLALVAFIVIYRRRNARQKADSEQKLDEFKLLLTEYESRKKSLSDKEQDIERMHKTLREEKTSIENRNAKASHSRKMLMRSLLDSELETFSKVAWRYFDRNTNAEERKRIEKDLPKLIKECNSEKVTGKMEFLADSIYDGVITELRKEVPKIDDRDTRYLILYLAGFSNNIISLLLGVSPEYCRNIKKRLKDKVMRSGSERAASLLQEVIDVQ